MTTTPAVRVHNYLITRRNSHRHGNDLPIDIISIQGVNGSARVLLAADLESLLVDFAAFREVLTMYVASGDKLTATEYAQRDQKARLILEDTKP